MKPVPQMLQFIANSSVDREATEHLELVFAAKSIVEQCRIKLALVTDEQVKKSLSDIIMYTADVLNALSKKDSPDELMEECKDLERVALTLPNHIQEKNTLGSMSHGIAKACLFVIAFSAAISVGFAFHAWYFAYLTGQVFLDYTVSALSFIGIPAASLGLFAHSIYRTENKKSKDINGLQEEVHSFCQFAVKTYDNEAKAAAAAPK